MPRPSKKAERTEEILQAFERCVARYGLEGSSLERIAAEAGLQRSLVRHFVGNRDDLVLMLTDRVIVQSDLQWQGFLEMLPPDAPIPALLQGLFHAESSDPAYVLVIESLIFAAGQNPEIQNRLQPWLERFNKDITELLQNQYPAAADADLAAVAFGIISLYFNLDSLAPLGMNQKYREPAIAAAKRLVATLEVSA